MTSQFLVVTRLLTIKQKLCSPFFNDIFDNFSFEAGAQPTFVSVLDKFDQFCKPRVSVFTARHQF